MDIFLGLRDDFRDVEDLRNQLASSRLLHGDGGGIDCTAQGQLSQQCDSGDAAGPARPAAARSGGDS